MSAAPDSIRARPARGPRSRWLFRLAALLAGAGAALALAEAGVRLWGLDWQEVAGSLPRMVEEQQVHMDSPDPRFIARLRPSSAASFQGRYGPYRVSVNSLGARGPERSAARPAGTFRIVCVGGSNVFGMGLNDHETWPAQLERYLRLSHPDRRWEVWNLAVEGYNLVQMVEASRWALASLAPDLLIFAPSNTGPRFFGSDDRLVRELFQRDPTLWLEQFSAADLQGPGLLSVEARLFLLHHVRLYRLVRLRLRPARSPAAFERLGVSPYHLKVAREFLQQAAGRVRLGLFICPAVEEPELFEPAHEGLGLPLLQLSGRRMPGRLFRDIHPPGGVMTWYVKELAPWLEEAGLLEPAGGGAARGNGSRRRRPGVAPPVMGSDLVPGYGPDQRPPAPDPLPGVTPGELVAVPADWFWRGDVESPDEGPLAHVFLPAFFIERTEVTVGQLRRFVAAGGYQDRRFWSEEGWRWPGRRGGPDRVDMPAELPAVNVSFWEAEAYCRWRGRRLPDEAEWEKAARGSDGRRYPWGNEQDRTRSNHWSVKVLPTSLRSGAWPAASLRQGASPCGALHMAGNVWEWTRSLYRGDGYDGRAVFGASAWGRWRSIRGGSWTTLLSYQRTTQREPAAPGERRFTLGFRCAADAPGPGTDEGTPPKDQEEKK